MTIFLRLLLVCISMSGCYSKRLLPEQPPESAAHRISPESLSADGKFVVQRFDGFIKQAKAALKTDYPSVSFSATAWYQFPKDDPNSILYYAAFDIVGAPSTGAAFSVIETAILKDWQIYAKEIKAKTGDDADFSYSVPAGTTDSFSMAFMIKKKKS